MDKKEFNNLLEKANLSKKEFSKITGIPYNTIVGWGTSNKPVPSWVKPFIDNYLIAKNIDEFCEKFCNDKTSNPDE
jgi:hypothetical protein